MDNSKYDPQAWAEAIGRPLDTWHGACHVVSLDIIRSGLLDEEYPNARIARGWAISIPGQHSWIATGDPYDRSDTIIDPTRWAWWSPTRPEIFVGKLGMKLHSPHGEGDIWAFGRPPRASGPEIKLEGLSENAETFLSIVGPLDREGWARLLNSPVGGWPSREIIAKAYEHEVLSVSIPIDIVGMLTDHNPSELYW